MSTYIEIVILLIVSCLILYYLDITNDMSLLIVLGFIVIILYITYIYNFTDNPKVRSEIEGMSEGLSAHVSQMEMYSKHFKKYKKNITCLSTYYNDWLTNDRDNLTSNLVADVANSKNKIDIIKLNYKKTKVKKDKNRKQNLYTINLGKYKVKIVPDKTNVVNATKVSEMKNNGFKDFNQGSFSICWNAKFDSKLMNIEDIDLSTTKKKTFEILCVRGHHTENDSPYYYDLLVNYCIELVNNDMTTLRYLEVTFDDNRIVSEEDGYNYNSLWKNRYADKFLRIYNDKLPGSSKNVSDNFYNFMVDNMEHTFCLVHNNSSLVMYVDGKLYGNEEDKTVEDGEQLYKYSKLTNLGEINQDIAPVTGGNTINFFSKHVTFGHKNHDSYIMINRKDSSPHNLMNSQTYINFLSIYSAALETNDIVIISDTLKKLSLRYYDISSELVQNEIAKTTALEEKVEKFQKAQTAIDLKSTTCSFSDPKVCEICASSSAVTKWDDMRDLFVNASKDCLNAVASHCINNPGDPECQFDKRVLERLNDIDLDKINKGLAYADDDTDEIMDDIYVPSGNDNNDTGEMSKGKEPDMSEAQELTFEELMARYGVDHDNTPNETVQTAFSKVLELGKTKLKEYQEEKK
jgi:hypothetical protein